MKNQLVAQYIGADVVVARGRLSVPSMSAAHMPAASMSAAQDSANNLIAAAGKCGERAVQAQAWAAKTASPATRFRRASRASVIVDRYREPSR
ncbi:hypothetical protein [Rhodococcoides yunnanense]|uniref:hypothetical protein n=1 Tax=Rhodococcoides yunnanense TaxID=278209 RepID=UPI0011146E1F|nr:hypothetical protein [Rhodococcus yunnanensis]